MSHGAPTVAAMADPIRSDVPATASGVTEPDDSERLDDAVRPLRDDVRFLGAVLGDTVRDQAGGKIFDLVETARRTAFAVRRSEADRDEVAALFTDVPATEMIPVIR
ncbi:phosphoenolpyruvate carboxylase, partial [Dietzia maris]|nr:phosphoenolpyruvate carboxylase [Dietzia maris]